MKDLKPNYRIFEKYSEYWQFITDYGKLPVPKFVRARIVNAEGNEIEERKHPVIELDKDQRWMTNYSQVL
tara:strand:- start:4883 stop:5092 length:210 start_codon:yes stop_codon:yes gene_type:complete